jgi:hypothetical protein
MLDDGRCELSKVVANDDFLGIIVLGYNRYGDGQGATDTESLCLALRVLVKVDLFVANTFGTEPLFDHAAIGTGICRKDSNILDHYFTPTSLFLVYAFVANKLYMALEDRARALYIVFFPYLLIETSVTLNTSGALAGIPEPLGGLAP